MTRKNNILVNHNWTIAEFDGYFTESFPYLSISIYYKGFEIPGHMKTYTLLELGSIKSAKSFSIHENLSVRELVELFWLNLGLLITISRKVGHSKLETSFTNQWTLKEQNDMGIKLNIEFENHK